MKQNRLFSRFVFQGIDFGNYRNNPDFLALIKVGRAVNAVISGVQFISDYMEDDISSRSSAVLASVFYNLWILI